MCGLRPAAGGPPRLRRAARKSQSPVGLHRSVSYSAALPHRGRPRLRYRRILQEMSGRAPAAPVVVSELRGLGLFGARFACCCEA